MSHSATFMPGRGIPFSVHWVLACVACVVAAPLIVLPHAWQTARPFFMEAVGCLLLTLLLVRTTSREDRGKFAWSTGSHLPLALLIIWEVVSFVGMTPDAGRGRTIALAELVRWITGAAICVSVGQLGQSGRAWRGASLVLLAGGILISVAGIVSVDSTRTVTNATAAFGNTQLLGACLGVLLPIAAVFAFGGRGRVARGAAWLALPLIAWALMLTGNRSSWLGSAAGLGLVTLIALRRRLRRPGGIAGTPRRPWPWIVPAFAAAGFLAICFGMTKAGERIQARLTAASIRPTLQARLQLWTPICLQMLQERPWTGHGIGSFPLKAANYSDKIPSAAQVERDGVSLSSVAHNEYLQLAAELGWPGLILYGWMLTAFFVRAIRALQTVRGARRWLLLGVVGSLAAQAVSALGNPGWHCADVSPLFWLLLGLGIGALPAAPQRTQRTKEPAWMTRPAARKVRWKLATMVGAGMFAACLAAVGDCSCCSRYCEARPDMFTNAIPGECDVVVTWATNRPPPLDWFVPRRYVPPPGSAFAVGTNTVTCFATYYYQGRDVIECSTFQVIVTATPGLLCVSNAIVFEGNSGFTNAMFTLNLSSGLPEVASVDFATADGTAIAGTDYLPTNGTVIFDVGETRKTIAVPVLGDTLDEANEAFFLRFSDPVHISLAQTQAVGTAMDDDVFLLSIGDATVAEGNAGVANVEFPVTLGGARSARASVDYVTVDGTAIGGEDYGITEGTLIFEPGETQKTITVAVFGDVLLESNEVFRVRLSNPTNLTPARTEAMGTIRDGRGFAVSIGDVIVPENDAGTNEAAFHVSLAAAPTHVATVDYATTDGTAMRQFDYLPVAGTLIFNPGETNKTITVPVLGDMLDESNEVFSVVLSNPNHLSLARAAGTGTILDSYTNLVILQQPINQVVNAGNSVGFNVSAISTYPPIRYQWRFNGADLLNATGPGLWLANVQLAQAGNYSVRVTDYVTSLVSDVATLGVRLPPTIVQTPPSQSVVAGSQVTLTVTVSNMAWLPIIYLWRTNDVPMKYFSLRAHSCSLSLTNVTANDARTYTVSTFNAAGHDSSLPAVLTVIPDTMPPNVVLRSPTNGAVFACPTNIQLWAEADDGDGSVSRVEFYAGAELLGSVTDSPYHLSWSNAPPGSHTLVVRAFDNEGAASNSVPVNITVADPPPALSILWRGHEALLSWPQGCSDFTLEQALEVNPVRWEPSDALVVGVEGRWNATVGVTNGSAFFRLRLE